MTPEEYQIALQNGILGTPETYGGILDQNQVGQARNNGIMNFGASLLAAGGPSTQRIGFGQALGNAILQGRSAQAQSTQAAISAALLKKQLTDKGKKDLVMTTGPDGQPVWTDANNAEGKGAFNPNSVHPVSSLQEWNAYNAMSPADQARYLQMKRAEQFKLGEVNGVQNVVTTAPGLTPSAPRVNAVPLTTVAQEAAGKAQIAGAEAGAKTTGTGMAERTLDQPRAKIALETSSASLDALANAAKEIQNNPALEKITGAQGKLPDWPGSEAADVRAQLKTLKAKTGFNSLQSMRDASKTGGALGSVSEREGEWLQNAMAALDNAQSPQAFKKQLQIIIDFADASKGRMQQGYDLTYGEHPSFTPEQTQKAPQAAIDHLKAHPELKDQFKAKYGYLP